MGASGGEKFRVLVVHNAYQEKGGEDSVVAAELGLLSANGHEVSSYRRHNDDLRGKSSVSMAVNALWSQRSSAELSINIEKFVPHVVHVHNTFPLISPSIYWVASAKRIPVVQTLHNFRLLCPQAQLLRDGAICEDCVGKVPWRAVYHSCYRGSTAQSAVSAMTVTAHRVLGTYRSRISRYIALNEFCKDKFIQGGLPADRIRIKPNFVASPSGMQEGSVNKSGGLFVGRLSPDKGVAVLLDALRGVSDIGVTVVGVGEFEQAVAAQMGAGYVGFKSLTEIFALMRGAAYLVVPSIWYENFPRTIVEAFACGLPVIASRLGALAEIVREGHTGLLFEPGQASDLLAKLRWAEQNPMEMKRMGLNARTEYEALYSPEKNYNVLLSVYREAVAEIAATR